MDDVEAEEHGDVQPRLFNRYMLKAVNFFGIGNPKNGARSVAFENFLHAAGLVFQKFRSGHAGQLRQLGDFLFPRHLAQQIPGFVVNLGFAERVGGGIGLRCGLRRNRNRLRKGS